MIKKWIESINDDGFHTSNRSLFTSRYLAVKELRDIDLYMERNEDKVV